MKHTKIGELVKILNKTSEPGVNMSDLRQYIIDELEKLGFDPFTKQYNL